MFARKAAERASEPVIDRDPGASPPPAAGIRTGAGRARATPAPTPGSQLQVHHLMKAYHGRQVVKDVSLEVHSGEVVGLLGPNGAGKTTCFYMIVGLVPSDDGRIELDGKPIGRLPIHRRARLGLSYLPQEASVFRKLTVEENITAVLELQSDDQGAPLSRPEIDRRLDALLGELQIGHIRSNPAMSLSGGERRRVEIARALATSPRFILLDEPFAGVDPIAVIEIQRIVKFLRERSIGVLITDHNVRETLGICDRAYIINAGTVLAFGRPEEIVDNESVRRVYLGEHFRM
jgi:lipopolysaccharide export system ATP-binding protein